MRSSVKARRSAVSAASIKATAAGVGEHEVALASTNAMVREIASSFPFVELMDTWTWFQSGINTDGAIRLQIRKSRVATFSR